MAQCHPCGSATARTSDGYCCSIIIWLAVSLLPHLPMIMLCFFWRPQRYFTCMDWYLAYVQARKLWKGAVSSLPSLYRWELASGHTSESMYAHSD